jgi:acetyl esterase/lipase
VAALPASIRTKTEAYGPDPLQVGDLRILRMPKGLGPFPVAVIVHGDCWTKGFATLSYMSPLASALTDAGIATWNVEYRQVGDAGGGWPGTYLDWAAASHHLRILAKSYALDLKRVIAIGHSAGASGAFWPSLEPFAQILLAGLPSSTSTGLYSPAIEASEPRSPAVASPRPNEPNFQIWVDHRLIVRSRNSPSTPLKPDFRPGIGDYAISGELWRVYDLADSTGATRTTCCNPRWQRATISPPPIRMSTRESA